METCMVRAYHTPRQPLQTHPSGHLGEWATPWSADEMLDWQHQRMDIPCTRKNCSQGPLAEKTGRGSLLNRPWCPLDDPIGHGTVLNWTELSLSREDLHFCVCDAPTLEPVTAPLKQLTTIERSQNSPTAHSILCLVYEAEAGGKSLLQSIPPGILLRFRYSQQLCLWTVRGRGHTGKLLLINPRLGYFVGYHGDTLRQNNDARVHNSSYNSGSVFRFSGGMRAWPWSNNWLAMIFVWNQLFCLNEIGLALPPRRSHSSKISVFSKILWN